AGVCARIAARILALTTAIWHNDHIGADIHRSLIAYDH
ncbi:MAG: IS982 family transposase, partial [Nocardioides sp.]